MLVIWSTLMWTKHFIMLVCVLIRVRVFFSGLVRAREHTNEVSA